MHKAPDFSKANCKNQPTKWWFPVWPMNKQAIVTTKKAKEICKTCSIKKKCFDYGVATQSFGIWGGVTLYDGKTQYRKSKQKQKQEIPT
jgi:hypothetical protein